MIIYFSGTGNSRFAAEYLAHQLNDEVLDSGRQIKSGEIGALHSERPWIFVTPTYSWQIPRVFSNYIQKLNLSGSRDAYFVLTCGLDIGNAGAYAAQLCQKKGLHYCGILQVVMPENYIAMFPVPTPAQSTIIVEKAKPVLQHAAEQIAQEQPFPDCHPGLLGRLKSSIINDGFYKHSVRADAFYSTDSCVGCGKCVDACVLNNIQLNDGRPVWGKNCTHCMACICGCPTEAIEYGKKSRGKPRYQCPKG